MNIPEDFGLETNVCYSNVRLCNDVDREVRGKLEELDCGLETKEE